VALGVLREPVLGVVVVVLAAFTIPRAKTVSRPIIDYLGIGFVSAGAAGLVLALILPLRLFRRQVFSLSVVLAFIVGFAMLGAITFLPTYFQYVRGVSATASGVQTLPLVVGLLVTSILSGTIIGRTGRCKIFPVTGSLLMGVGHDRRSQQG
jgi:hypothetical protein